MALRVEGLGVTYGRRTAVDDLSLAVPDGSITGFLGHNGAGKTSAMRAVLGLVRPRRGAVAVDGIDARRHPAEARARLGAVIETTSFHAGWSARANLYHLARLGGATAPDARADVDRCLEQVGLIGDAERRPSAFSQGMRQRLGLAQALLGGRRTLLLDEPTNGLDPEGIAELATVLRRLRDEEGAAILLSSHLLAEVEELCDRVAILREGRLVASGATVDLLRGAGDPHRARVARVDAARAVLAELGLEATAEGSRVDFELGTKGPGEVLAALANSDAGPSSFGPQPRTLVGLYARARSGDLTPEQLGADGSTAASAATNAATPSARNRGGLRRVLRYELARLARGAWWLLLPAALSALAVARLRGKTDALLTDGEVFSAAEPTAFAATAAGLATSLPSVALIATLAASLSIAGELGRGTLRNAALRPITRFQLAFGKALVALGVALAAWGAAALGALLAAAHWFRFGDLEEVLITGDRFPLMTAAEVRPELDLALAGTLIAVMPAAATGFLIGSLVRRGVVAVVVALVVHQLLDGGRALARAANLEWALPSAYLPSPLGDTSRVASLRFLAEGATNAPFEFAPWEWWVPLAWTVVPLVLALPLVRRRSIF